MVLFGRKEMLAILIVTAQLIAAGTAAVKAVDPNVIMMLHVALGGQNDESVFFIDNMIARGVHFDVIGESYYPKWHGTLMILKTICMISFVDITKM